MTKSKCCVDGCESSPPHFKFPTSRVLIRKWLAALGTHCDLKVADTHTAGSVCSRHFLTEEWECARGRVRLKKGVVPSLFKNEKQENDTTNLTDNVPNTEDELKGTKENNTDNSQDSLERADPKKRDHPTKESDVPPKDCGDPPKDSDVLKDSSEELKDKNGPQDKEIPENGKDSTLKETNDTDKEKDEPSKKSDDPPKESDDKQKDMLGEKEMTNGKEGSGEDRLQEKAKDIEEASKSNKSLDSKKNKDKSKESSPKLPSGPRDIDKDKVEDIEELLMYYHIKQNNIHNTTEEIPGEQTGTSKYGSEQVEVEFEPVPAADPVFIEISVDKDTSANGGDKNDCLMVLESVQVEVDPSSLMLQEQDFQDMDVDMETLEIEEDPPNEKEDPISLLTSSDEDDVIIQEPHIDTVEVSDETDEDDMPLVKLLRKRRAEKKKNITKKVPRRDIPQITWGMYEYYCAQCHFKTSNAAEYKKHMSAHAKVILMCQLCGYMTASSSQFAKHEKQHGDKTYKCNQCDFKAKRNISLVYHMKSHKEVPKEFKCGECDYVAYSDQAILKHLRFCKDGKKYKCNKCSYSTKKRSDLKRHRSRKHDDDEDQDEDYVPPARCMD